MIFPVRRLKAQLQSLALSLTHTFLPVPQLHLSDTPNLCLFVTLQALTLAAFFFYLFVLVLAQTVSFLFVNAALSMHVRVCEGETQLLEYEMCPQLDPLLLLLMNAAFLIRSFIQHKQSW